MLPSKTLSDHWAYLCSIFVTTNGDIYIDNGESNDRVDKRTVDSSASIPIMQVNSACQVVKKHLNDNSTVTTIAASTSTFGDAENLLWSPTGISVDVNSDLYVADYGNHRIQLFKFGQLNGSTVAGSKSKIDNRDRDSSFV